MIYLKYFETDAQYNSFLNSEDFIEPNVSFVEQSSKKHYNQRKSDINPTVSIVGWTYGDTPNDPIVSGNFGGGAVTYYYKLQSTSSWSTTKPTNAGSYNIRADIAETKRYHSGTCSSTFTISKASRTISFETAPTSVKPEETATVSATPSAGVGDGTITYSSSDPTIASVNGNVLSGVSTGSCTITATISQGNNYLSASTSYTLNVSEGMVVKCVYHVEEGGGSGSGSGSGGDDGIRIKLLNNTSGIESMTVNGVKTEVREYYTFTEASDYTVEFYLSENKINDFAFASCSSLSSVTIPNSVTSIGGSAFDNCTGLTSIDIPDSVTSIGESAFNSTPWYDSYSADTDNIYDNVIYINNVAYQAIDNTITSVSFKNTTAGIGGAAFAYCNSLTSVTIPNSVTSIGSTAFASCSSLTSVTIPNSVTNVGNYAFQDCSGMATCTIGSGATSIGNGVFYRCSSLTSVSIPNSVTSIRAEAFRGCSRLTSIDIPNSVTSIGGSAFRDCVGLTSCTIGSSVTSIGSSAFRNCNSLTSITIPSGVTSISVEVFQSCSSLTSCTIGSGVTSIEGYAFNSCTGLTSIDIPDSVTSIGSYAFYNCRSLTNITCNATTAPTIYSNTFQEVKTSGTLYVPGGSDYSTWMGTSSYYLGYYSWTKVEQ